MLFNVLLCYHEDVMAWKRSVHYWPFVRGITGGFPSQRASNAGRACVFFVVILKKLLNKQSSCWWFEAPWHSCVVTVMNSQWKNKNSPGPWFNIKMSSYQYRNSHCGDKTILRSSYLDNGISYTGKITSLYWISPQGSSLPCVIFTIHACLHSDGHV